MERSQIVKSYYVQSPQEKIAQIIRESTGYSVSPLSVYEIKKNPYAVYTCMHGDLLFVVKQIAGENKYSIKKLAL